MAGNDLQLSGRLCFEENEAYLLVGRMERYWNLVQLIQIVRMYFLVITDDTNTLAKRHCNRCLPSWFMQLRRTKAATMI